MNEKWERNETKNQYNVGFLLITWNTLLLKLSRMIKINEIVEKFHNFNALFVDLILKKDQKAVYMHGAV